MQLSALDLQQRTEPTVLQMRITTNSLQRDYVYLTGEANKQTRFPLPLKKHANLANALAVERRPFHNHGKYWPSLHPTETQFR